MTRYVEAFTWTGTIQKFLDEVVTERPLLNVCAGRTRWGDAVTMDRYEPADVHGTWTHLPFADNSFGAVFADPPWDAEYKTDVALFVREAVRLAPVAYLMAPWTYGASWLNLTRVWVRQMPGVNRTISLTRYERRGDIPPPGGSAGWTGHSWNAQGRREARVRALARDHDLHPRNTVVQHCPFRGSLAPVEAIHQILDNRVYHAGDFSDVP